MKLRVVAVAAVLSLSTFFTSYAQAAPRDEKANPDLLMGAATGDLALIRSALKRGAELEIRDSQYLFTPLGWAAWRGRPRAVRALLAAGAKVNARSEGGPLMPIRLKKPVNGVPLAVEPSDQTPLALAVLGNMPSATAVCRELLRGGANPNARTSRGNTALLYALVQSDPDLINVLLENGADPNIRGENEALSPLTIAVLRPEGENIPLLRDVLKAGARPNDTFLGHPLPTVARITKRVRTATFLEAVLRQRKEKQMREAAKPPVLFPEVTATSIVLE